MKRGHDADIGNIGPRAEHFVDLPAHLFEISARMNEPHVPKKVIREIGEKMKFARQRRNAEMRMKERLPEGRLIVDKTELAA